jgi:hypothetical protein
MLGCKQAALQIAGETVRSVGRLLEHADALARRVLHAPVVVDVREQEIAAFPPPQRTFGRAQIATEARGQFVDWFGSRDDLVESGIELLDLPGRLCQTFPAAAHERHAAGRR